MSSRQTVVRRLSTLAPASPVPPPTSASSSMIPRPLSPTPATSAPAASPSASAPPPTSASRTYHKISTGFKLPAPLHSSPSMMLLNDAAEALSSNRSNFQRMKVRTTTQVFEILKPASISAAAQLAVFKPATDEEDGFVVPLSTSSSTAASSGSLWFPDNATTRFFHGPEERAVRERAAYVLDKAYEGFSRVPATVLAQVDSSHGSLQAFINNLGSVEDLPDLALDTESVQRVAMLDCRIFNLDRHSGNVLVVKDEGQTQHGLIPIDHSLSLPPWYDLSGAWFDWAYLPCASAPLTEAVRAHIAELDVARDAERLAELGLQPECIATNTIATMTLQAMAQHPHSGGEEVTLKELSEMFQRPFPKGHLQHDDKLSPLEELVKLASATAGANPTTDPEAFSQAFANALDDFIPSRKWREYVI
ncbi:hypothetical protein BASA81_002440 [Batrachochytrium salamandrivorans]|nr:hypothetical protein BASA81_002440 [Batrachochytrium salamandrivorans]